MNGVAMREQKFDEPWSNVASSASYTHNSIFLRHYLPPTKEKNEKKQPPTNAWITPTTTEKRFELSSLYGGTATVTLVSSLILPFISKVQRGKQSFYFCQIIMDELPKKEK